MESHRQPNHRTTDCSIGRPQGRPTLRFTAPHFGRSHLAKHTRARVCLLLLSAVERVQAAAKLLIELCKLSRPCVVVFLQETQGFSDDFARGAVAGAPA